MANEETLWIAIVKVLEADTGAGGVVTLIGKANPIVEWGDDGMNTLPIVAASRGETVRWAADERHLLVPMTFDVFAGRYTGDLAIRVRDRVGVVLTAQNLSAQGVGAAPFFRRQRNPSSLEQGARREAVDIDFLMTR